MLGATTEKVQFPHEQDDLGSTKNTLQSDLNQNGVGCRNQDIHLLNLLLHFRICVMEPVTRDQLHQHLS